MKKTHKDRINLIDRLERKYARKVQLRAQYRQQKIKNTLRMMRGWHFDPEDKRVESVEGTFRQSTKIAF